MAEVEIRSQIKLGLKEILEGISQLDISDIESFLKEVAHILAQKKESGIQEKREEHLLKQIQVSYPPELTTRYQELSAKLTDGELSQKEQGEYLHISDQFEKLDAQRLSQLLELSALRNTPLPLLIRELSLPSPPSTHA